MELFDGWRNLGSPGTFTRHVRHADKAALELVGEQPALTWALPKDIRRMLRKDKAGERPKRLPDRILSAYMGPLGAIYVQANDRSDTLDAFLARIRLSCPTEATLRAYVSSRRPLS